MIPPQSAGMPPALTGMIAYQPQPPGSRHLPRMNFIEEIIPLGSGSQPNGTPGDIRYAKSRYDQQLA